MNGNISFNIITPQYFGRVQLSLLVLKSYIHSKNPDLTMQLNSFYSEDDADTIVEEISRQGNTILLFSLYVWTEEIVRTVCRRLKELNNDYIIIIGGNIPTYQGAFLLETYPFYDFAVIGEGENTLYQLFDYINQDKADFSTIDNIIYRQNHEIITTRRSDNYNIEEQDYPLLLDDFRDDEIIFYETSRGCKYRCRYCAYNMNFNGKNVVRYYSNQKVENDLRRIFNLPYIKKLDFTDSTLIGNRNRGLWILSLLNTLNSERVAAGKNPIEIGIDVSLEDFDDEILYEVKRLHTFAYGFGLQSIDREVIRKAARVFNRDKFTKYFNALTKKSKAAVNLELMFGLPGDTLEKFLNSLEYSISDLDAHFVVCFRFAVLPGSTFWKDKEKYGITCEELSPYYTLASATFSEEDLQTAELLSFYLQLIYTCFRGIKRIVDRNFHGEKVPVYLKLSALLQENYDDFFHNDRLRQGDVYKFVIKLATQEYSDIKRSIQMDLRNELKQLIENYSTS
ncbi:MAG: radical SAM protein [Spirochaetales bacterium]|nr:radical SAM protein [Spirochaetales bacterium]